MLFNTFFLGKSSYRPYFVSSNKRNARKVVINRYAKGNNRYRAKNLSEEINIPVGGDESEDEWADINNTKDESYSSVKNTYKDAQKRLFENWRKISPKLFDIMIENDAFDKNAKCFKCSLPATCRCLDCGSRIYLCLECNNLFHKDINLFHRKIFVNEIIGKENINLPQICSKFCEHDIKEVLVINLKGKI